MYYVSDIVFNTKPVDKHGGVTDFIEVRDSDSTEMEYLTFEEIMMLILSGVAIKGAGLYYRYEDFVSKIPSSVCCREMVCLRGKIKHYILIDSYGDYKKTVSYSLRYGTKIVVGVDNSLLYIDVNNIDGKVLDLSDIDIVDLSRLEIIGTNFQSVTVKLGETTKFIMLPDHAFGVSTNHFMYHVIFDLTDCSEVVLKRNIENIFRYSMVQVAYRGNYDKFADIYFNYILEKLSKGIEDELYYIDSTKYISWHFTNELYEVIKVRIEKYITDKSFYIDSVLSKSGSDAVHSALSTVLSNKKNLKWLNLKGEFSSEKYSRDKFEFVFYTIALLNLMKSFKNISGYLNLCLCLGEYGIVINSVRKYCNSRIPDWVYDDSKRKRVNGSIKDIVDTIYYSSRHYKEQSEI